MVLLTLIPAASAQIAGVSVGSAYLYNQGYPAKQILSDTWAPTWADDGVLYTPSDDALTGWNGTSGTHNILFSSLSGWTSSTTGSLVNNMTNFGTAGQLGSDSLDYKSSGLISVGGVLYMSVDRQSLSLPGAGTGCTNGRGFTKQNAQIIKSSDHGATWTPLPPSTANPYVSPMFSGTGFASIWFVQYGQNYSCPGIDNCSTYVYGVSPATGYQSEADSMIMGRVSIANIGNLSAADWQWYQGGDGSNPANWGAQGTAASIMSATCQIGESGIQYFPALNRYVMIQFYYPDPSVQADSYWQFWQAPHPWGTWTKIGGPIHWNPQGYYMASFVPQSVSGNTATIFTTGDYTSTDPATGKYTLTIIPVTFTTGGVASSAGTKMSAGTAVQ